MKHAIGILLVCILLTGCGTIRPEEKNLFIVRDFTAPNSFTNGVEGPAVDAEGNLFAVNFEKRGTIGRVTPSGEASVFVTLPEGSTGNGIRFGRDGAMYVADYTKCNVLRIDMKTREVSVFSHDPTMTRLNDVAVDENGKLFASDPNWTSNTGQIWRIEPDGKAVRLEGNMSTANGIDIDWKRHILYVGETGSRKIWAYDLSPRGEISNKRLLIEFGDACVSDGMRLDAGGNLYVTVGHPEMGRVMIVSPKGRILREVKLLGKKPTNITFGGPDGRTCYVTEKERRNILVFRADTPGQTHRR